jgi:alkylated DNA repair protein alkB family protein 8
MRKEYANELLAASRAGYNTIAPEFSRTRGTFWPELAFVRDLIPEESRLLDIGCGNGRFLGTLEGKAVSYTGIDFSEGLVGVAHARYRERPQTEFVVGDALALPFRDDSFDNTVSFAVLHHIPSREYRVRFLREAARVTKPGGFIILTAWNVWHSRPRIVLEFALKKLLGGTHTDFGDAILDFGKEKNARYVHALSMREIRSLVHEAGLTLERLEKIRRPSGEENFFVMLRVPQN